MRSTRPDPNDKLQAATTAADDDDYTSSSGVSSSESESEGDDIEDEDENMDDYHTAKRISAAPQATCSSSIPSIPGRPKPTIHRLDGGSDLLSRLSSFLPQMEHANADLEREIAAGRGKSMILDEVDDEDEKEYIEMNLGLGVLKGKRGGDDISSSEDETEDETDGDAGPARDQSNQKSEKEADEDVLDKLMGGKQSAAGKPSIEEMAE